MCAEKLPFEIRWPRFWLPVVFGTVFLLFACSPFKTTGNGEPYSGVQDSERVDSDDPFAFPGKTYELKAVSENRKTLVSYHEEGLHQTVVLEKDYTGQYRLLSSEQTIKKNINGTRVYENDKVKVSVSDDEATLEILSQDGTDAHQLRANQFECAGLEHRVPFAGGEGTQANPFKICSAEQLNNIRGSYLGAYYVLWRNVDLAAYSLGAGWDPIGNSITPFHGNFDGNLFQISNLKIYKHIAWEPAGLFGVVTSGGVLSNMRIFDVDLNSQSEVGALVGRLAHAQILNVHTTGSVRARDAWAGGAIGRVKNVEDSTCRYLIYRSSSSANVTAANQVGGLIGSVDNGACSGVIDNSNTSGLVSAADSSIGNGMIAGGLAGIIYNAKITNSFSTSTVSANSNAGGLLGAAHGGEIENSFHSGSVTAYSGGAGGILGIAFDDTVINRSYASSSIFSEYAAGGIVGLALYNPSIANSFFAGDLSREGGVDDTFVGGIVGFKDLNDIRPVNIENSYWARINAALGSINCVGNLASDFCDPQGADERANISDFYGSTAAPLDTWDFSSVWESRDDGLPLLRKVY